MTNVEALTVAINLVNDEEVKAKLEKMRTQYQKKVSSVNSKKKAETDARAERVYNALVEIGEPVTCSDLINTTSDEEVSIYSVARVTALLKKLGDRVKHEMKGKKSLYSVA